MDPNKKMDAKERMKANIVAAAQDRETTLSISDLTMRWLFGRRDPALSFAEQATRDFLAGDIDGDAETGRKEFCQQHGLSALVSPVNGRWIFLKKYTLREISMAETGNLYG